ncbi:MAG TPA: META domain-containing protein [candidate division Zixibacteria bacterium]|nr:META domain-containing protein [candidate division Zixibacteria bacterium]
MKQKYIVLLVIGVLAALVIAGCTSANTDNDAATVEVETPQEVAAEEPEQDVTGVEKQIQVGPILVDCEGEGPQECMLIREHEMDRWELWYSQISGFEYEEGYLYNLLLEERPVENPPAGGSTIEWVLVEELSKTPVTFTTVIVGPEQVECEGEGPQLCYQVKTDPDGEWQLFYSQIEGFDYEPGHEYELVVAEIPVQNPPAGGSSIQYLLVEEVSKTPAVIEEEEQAQVTSTIWAATSIRGQSVLEGSGVVMGIAPGRIGGFSGCNTYFGPVEVDRNKVSVGPLSSTRVACAEELMTQESEYLAALDSAATVEIDGDQMTVFDDSGEIVLTFVNVEPLPLEGTAWELTTYNNGENAMVSVHADTFVSANFDDGDISGSAGCNNYFGTYEATEDTIAIGPLASTMMLCPDPVNEQEQLFLAALESAATYQIIANRLELINGDGALAAMFHAAEPLEFAGTSWTVQSYNNGRGGVTSVIIGTELTVDFDVEAVAGLAGCNNYTGSYEVDGETISFGPLATTRKFCSDPEGIMEQESEFLAALGGTATFEVQGNRMDMYFEDGARAVVLEIVK